MGFTKDSEPTWVRSSLWRRERDSNPRYPLGKAVFKTACFNHSHIPPRVAVQSYDSDAAGQSKERLPQSKLRQENLGSHTCMIAGSGSSHSGTYAEDFYIH